MGNQQSQSSNLTNDLNNLGLNKNLNNKEFIISNLENQSFHTPNKQNETLNSINMSSTSIGNKSEVFSDITMKETNESFKSVDGSEKEYTFKIEKVPKNDNANNLNGENKIDNNNKASIKFEWNEGGDIVYISGTFSNWTHWFLMEKKNKNFEIFLVNYLIF